MHLPRHQHILVQQIPERLQQFAHRAGPATQCGPAQLHALTAIYLRLAIMRSMFRELRCDDTRQPDPADAVSLPLVTKMSSERTLAVQAALMQQPQKTVAMLVWSLCQKVFVVCSTQSHPLQISLTCSHYSLCDNAPSGKTGVAWRVLMEERNRLQALLPEGWQNDFTTFFTLDDSVLMSLMALCTAFSVNGVQTREHGFTSRSPLNDLETAMNFHLRDWWQPEKVAFFGQLSKAQIVDALTDAGLTGAARNAEKMKKEDATEYAESQMSGNRWVPAWMAAPVVARFRLRQTRITRQKPPDNTAPPCGAAIRSDVHVQPQY